MTKPGTVVDVVGSEHGAHELLKEVGLFIAALRRAETRKCTATGLFAYIEEPCRDQIQCFIPRGFTKSGHDLTRIDKTSGLAPAAVRAADFGRKRVLGVVDSNQGRGEPFGVHRVVEAVAPLYAESSATAGALATFRVLNAVGGSVSLIANRTADTAVGTN